MRAMTAQSAAPALLSAAVRNAYQEPSAALALSTLPVPAVVWAQPARSIAFSAVTERVGHLAFAFTDIAGDA